MARDLKSRIEKYTNHIHAVSSDDLVERFNQAMEGTGHRLDNIGHQKIDLFYYDKERDILFARSTDTRGTEAI